MNYCRHLRLELLEGVVAYHYNEIEKCRELLTSAQKKLSELQVSDEAKRAAVSFTHEERDREAEKHAQTKKEIKLECELAAEGLQRNENDTDKLQDNLTDLDLNSEIQLDVETMKRKRQEQAKEAIISEFVFMGFERSKVMLAVAICRTKEDTLMQLLALRRKPNNG